MRLPSLLSSSAHVDRAMPDGLRLNITAEAFIRTLLCDSPASLVSKVLLPEVAIKGIGRAAQDTALEP